MHKTIAGVDEAGRGPLAGPVVAACCILPTQCKIPDYITDSKLLSERKRNQAFEWITEHCLFGVGSATAKYIDAHGIKKATHKAMKQAVKALQQQHQITELLIDGNDGFTFAVPATSIVRGDLHHSCISAASIIAKVTRDTAVLRAHKKFPNYGFNKNKGYGTAAHRMSIQAHGLTPYHRATFCSRWV